MKEIMASYNDLFTIIFTFIVPIIKLGAMICGVLLLDDLRWIAHQIRKNAAGYDTKKE